MEGGSSPSIIFAAHLRVCDGFTSLLASPRSNDSPFSFYNKDMEKWKTRLAQNKERDLQSCKGLALGPSVNSVFRVFDTEARGNTGLVYFVQHDQG